MVSGTLTKYYCRARVYIFQQQTGQNYNKSVMTLNLSSYRITWGGLFTFLYFKFIIKQTFYLPG